MMSEIRDLIVQLHGQNILRKSAMNIRGGAGVIERCMSGNGYGTAIEIGTFRGVSSAEMSRFCDRVITFDLHSGRLEQLGERFDREAFWQSLGIDNIELKLVSDDREKADIIAGLDFDFAFIDGGHDSVSVARDFEMVKRCGRVLFHDYDRRGVPGQDDVCDFIDSLPKHQIEKMDIFALWTAQK